MARIVLVRHGESVATVEQRIAGHRTCTGLSPLGVRQAERLATRWEELAEFDADRLIASNFARAGQTAAIIAPALKRDVEVEPAFGEHDPGPDIDGITFVDYNQRFPDFSAAWNAGDAYANMFPGGETVAAFHLRVGERLHALTDELGDGTAVIVCHGGVIDAVLRHAVKAPPMAQFQLFTANTSITELVLVSPNMWRLLRYNDAAHLRGLEDE